MGKEDECFYLIVKTDESFNFVVKEEEVQRFRAGS